MEFVGTYDCGPLECWSGKALEDVWLVSDSEKHGVRVRCCTAIEGITPPRDRG